MPNIVIIGSGPAGVSAALYAARAGVQTTVLTKGPGALDRAELIQNYYGFAEPITGAELERRGIEGAKAVGVEFVTTEAVGLTYTDKLTVETLAGDFPADAVILATGASRAAPRIPGLAGLEGHGVSYCATCDAHFYRGKTVAVLGYSAQSCREADFLAETCEKVLYFPAVPHEVQVGEGVEVIREKPTAILGDRQARILETNSQKQYAVDGIFVLRAAVAPEKLVPGIAVEENHVRVDLQMRTNLPGCFACGDVTGPPYQYIKAAGQGNVAALSAAAYLAEQKKKE